MPSFTARAALVAACLAALAALAAPADAQTAPPPCATLTVAHVAPAEFARLGAQAVLVDVRNNAQFSEVSAVVRANLADAAWSLDVAEHSVRLAPGTNQTVAFTVTAPDVAGATATLNVVAAGSCTANGQALPIAAVGAVPEATDSVPLTVAAGGGLALPTSIEAVPPAYFLGGLGLVVVVIGAVLAARRRQGGFDVRSPEPEKPVRPGRGASFPLELVNRGRQPDTARFEVGEVAQGWTAFMALPELTLAPGESRTLWLMVRAPPEAPDGAACVVPVVVRAKGNPKKESRVAVRAEVKPEAAAGGGVEATRLG